MYLGRLDKFMGHFIISFMLADIAIMLAQAMAVWQIYQKLGASAITAITLITLFINAFITKKYSYLLDKYPRKTMMSGANFIFITLLSTTLITDSTWAYVVISLYTSLYFSCFYLARGALAQAILIQRTQNTQDNFRKMNATLMITDKLGALGVNAVVAGLFVYLGVDKLVWLSLVILLLASLFLTNLSEPNIIHSPKTTQNTPTNTTQARHQKNFAWFFCHTISPLVVMAVFITVLVMASNTINTIYLYDVLKLTPEVVVYPSIAYNTTALIGGVVVVWFYHEKYTLYACFTATVLMALCLAIYPIFAMFVVSALVFGFVNSVNRVMYDSLIMKSIANQEIATFYGFLGSINQTAQLISTILIHLFVWASSEQPTPLNIAWVIWGYPLLFLLLPCVLVLGKIIVQHKNTP